MANSGQTYQILRSGPQQQHRVTNKLFWSNILIYFVRNLYNFSNWSNLVGCYIEGRRIAVRIAHDRRDSRNREGEMIISSLYWGGGREVTCLGVSKTILIGIETGRFQNRLSSLLRVGSHLVDRRRCKNLVPGWVNGHRRGGQRKTKVVVTWRCYHYYYYYTIITYTGWEKSRTIFLHFSTRIRACLCAPARHSRRSASYVIFSTGGEGGGVTHNGACNNEYLRITFWANVKNGGRGDIRCSRLVLT